MPLANGVDLYGKAPRRHYLRECGLTQDDLSLLAGTSLNEIADYETDERRIGLEMQYKLIWAHRLETAAAMHHSWEPGC
jgi:hypothetical protein